MIPDWQHRQRAFFFNQGGHAVLVLSRRVDESVRIGDAVVTIISVVGGVVKVGIVAPKSVEILRTELEKPVDEYQKGDCYFNGQSRE
jgi:carbon storage regulator